jgi:hypothetical protein
LAHQYTSQKTGGCKKCDNYRVVFYPSFQAEEKHQHEVSLYVNGIEQFSAGFISPFV